MLILITLEVLIRIKRAGSGVGTGVGIGVGSGVGVGAEVGSGVVMIVSGAGTGVAFRSGVVTMINSGTIVGAAVGVDAAEPASLIPQAQRTSARLRISSERCSFLIYGFLLSKKLQTAA